MQEFGISLLRSQTITLIFIISLFLQTFIIRNRLKINYLFITHITNGKNSYIAKYIFKNSLQVLNCLFP